MTNKRNYIEIAHQYCADVLDGTIPACKYVKQACNRHLDDLEKSKSDPEYPFWFSEEKASRRCSFSEKFRHIKGKWTGKRLILSDHQVFIQCAIWGWLKRGSNLRRFATAYIEEPRKQGKSTDAATTGLYMLKMDDEYGAEIYSGATTEKQALEVFRPAWLMAKGSPQFIEKYGIELSGTPKNPTSIYVLDDMSRFELLIGNPGEGSSPSCAIIDEYHEHKSPDQYDTMETGMGSREQPLMFVITTAGNNVAGPCYEMHLRAIKVLESTIEDESLFAIIYTIDEEDDYRDFEVWKKANPNYGVSVIEDYLKRKHNECLTNVAKQNINKCKHLNVWTNAGVAWMNMVKWAQCAKSDLKLENFTGQPCYLSLDLASKIDICALIVLFQTNPREVETIHIDEDDGRERVIVKTEFDYVTFGKYYLPEETVQMPGNEHYVKWVKEGLITQTPGARTDFLYIEQDIKRINAKNPIIELPYDPRESGYLINNIMEWYDPERCVEITQGPAQMSQPMKELEALIYSNQIFFDGDPILTWMISNVVKKQGRSTGPVKYYYPTKELEKNKIDGAVALIMAVARAMLNEGPPRSIYEDMDEDQIKQRMAL